MNKADKIRVAVLYGGRSGEHEVSLNSAANVIQHLDRTLFDVIPIGIDKQGGWYLGDDVYQPELNAPSALTLQTDQAKMLFNPNLIGKSFPSLNPKQMALTGRVFDVIFPVIHGPLCEDGTVQGLLELVDVPYVGAGVLASAVGMDKDVSKRLVEHAGIAIPPYLTIKQDLWDQHPLHFAERVSEKLSYPVFVKPANTGSSVGVHKVKHPEDLFFAINDAFLYDTKIVVEQGIDAIEIEVAVLESLVGTDEPITSLPGEVRPNEQHGFYSYASKYLDEQGAELIIPAALATPIQQKIRHLAKDIFLALECEGMARVDLFLDRTTHQIYFNEINTIPGFTKISMYPKLMAASGIHYSELLTHLVKLAMIRHAKKTRLNRGIKL